MFINLDGKRQLDKLYNDKTAGFYCVPTKHDIENLRIGDTVPNCFGRLGEINEIYARGKSINGKAYICFYVTWHGKDSQISQSFTENVLPITVPLTYKYGRTENVPV